MQKNHTTNSIRIENIMLDDILPAALTRIPTPIPTPSVLVTTFRKFGKALSASVATTIIKPLNLDATATQTKSGNAVAAGMLTGSLQRQQLTTLLVKATKTTTVKAYDLLSKINNKNSYYRNTNNSSDMKITTVDAFGSYNNYNSSATAIINPAEISTTTASTITTATTYTTIIDFTSIISSSSSSIIAAAASSASSLSSPSSILPSTITLPLAIATTPTASSLISDTFLIGDNAVAAAAATSIDSTTMSALIGSTSITATQSCLAWPKALIVAIFFMLILITIVGNTLVILAVLTTRRLRTVTNCFVMNLAITDWLVGTCVMPPAAIYYYFGSWRFGWILCDIWISLDVLLCTGSILSLCAISLDRYLAVTQPLTYSKKRRSKRLALFMIFIVWVTALSITCPPYLGWYEPGRYKGGYVDCHYNKNKGYVVFSAMGSFFIPLAVMMYVYLKIGYVLTSRRQRIVRDANSERTADHEIDCDNFLSESEHFQCATPKFPSLKTRWTINSSKKNSLHCEKCNSNHLEQVGLRHEASFYELVEISRLSSLIHCSAISCKYGGPCIHTTPLGVKIANGDGDVGGNANGRCVANGSGSNKHANTLPKLPNGLYSESRASFSETCLTTTTTTTTLQNVKFNDELHHHPSHHQLQQQQHHNHHHNHHHQQQQQQKHQHHPHRIPMRISTTKRDTKTTKTLTIVMGGFVACWLPFFVYYLLIPFLPPAAFIEALQTGLTWIGWVNCAINPFIYAFYNPDFRIAFWRLTCRRICKQKPPSNHMAMFRG